MPLSPWSLTSFLLEQYLTSLPYNSLIAMVKDTSLAANITVVEMFRAAEQINARVYEPLALYIEVGMIYLLFSTALTWLQRVGERKLSAYESREG